MARFRRFLFLLCLASFCIHTCPLFGGTSMLIIDENGHSLASLFDGLRPRNLLRCARASTAPFAVGSMHGIGGPDR
jgi:hypothetical protein